MKGKRTIGNIKDIPKISWTRTPNGPITGVTVTDSDGNIISGRVITYEPTPWYILLLRWITEKMRGKRIL